MLDPRYYTGSDDRDDPDDPEPRYLCAVCKCELHASERRDGECGRCLENYEANRREDDVFERETER